MKDPVCIENRVIINPHDYSEENRLAIIVPQTKLNPKQIFCTPMHLVPLTLPTECKTIISIYVLYQLFADFDKTCKKRITLTGIT